MAASDGARIDAEDDEADGLVDAKGSLACDKEEAQDDHKENKPRADSADQYDSDGSDDGIFSWLKQKKDGREEGGTEGGKADKPKPRRSKQQIEKERQQEQQQEQLKKAGYAAYPVKEGYALDENLLVQHAGDKAAWLGNVLEHVLQSEIESAAEVYEAEHPRLVVKLRDLARRATKRARGVFKTALASESPVKRRQPNPKNEELRAREAELRAQLRKLEGELQAWDAEEKRRLDSIKRAAAAMKTASAASAPSDAQDEIRPEEDKPKVPLAPSGAALTKRLETVVKQLEFINAKLRSAKVQMGRADGLSEDLAKAVEAKAFAAFKDVHEPQKLIKAITTSE